MLAMPVAELAKTLLALDPFNRLILALGKTASVTNTLLVEVNRHLLRILRMLVLNHRIRALIRDHAPLAIAYFAGESVLGRRAGTVLGERG